MQSRRVRFIIFSFLRNAGRGIFNNKGTTIPKGCYFGHYRGKTFSPKEYATVKESGYAWEVLDSANKIRVAGFVDPGPDPDEKLEWLALVNSANFKSELISNRLFRACKIIITGG